MKRCIRNWSLTDNSKKVTSASSFLFLHSYYILWKIHSSYSPCVPRKIATQHYKKNIISSFKILSFTILGMFQNGWVQWRTVWIKRKRNSSTGKKPTDASIPPFRIPQRPMTSPRAETVKEVIARKYKYVFFKIFENTWLCVSRILSVARWIIQSVERSPF